MKYSKILLCMTALVCLAFQASAQSGYFNPHVGNPDEGLASMLQWIDRPVPNYPWYTTGGTFYTQPYSDSTFSSFREYYIPSGAPVVGG
jgi:hypothetical protein